MSTGSISNLSTYLQSLLATSLQSTGSTTQNTSNLLSSLDSVSGSQSDNSQLSPLANLLSTLQSLQQSDPTKYQQVTQQIATNLQAAAKTATADGNTTAATQLNQLATDFSNASSSNSLPNISDLAQALGGHHHHHHVSSSDSDSSSSSSTSTTSSSTSSSDSSLSALLAAFQSNSTQSDSLNPMSIIFNTLSTAGVTSTSS